jgi:hypothetical protein
MTITDYKTGFSEKFEHGLVYAKGYLLVLLLLVTLFYQMQKYSGTNTFFSKRCTVEKSIFTAFISGGIGALTVLFVLNFSRSGNSKKDILMATSLVFIILFLFDIAEESSGYRLYNSLDELKLKHGPYASLNDTSSKAIQDMTGRNNATGDPFLHSVALAAIASSVLYVLYLVGVMVTATYYGYNSGQTNINDVTFFNGMFSPATGFSIELFFMALNGFTPILAAYVRGETINDNVYQNSAMFLFGSLILHTGAQYSGLYGINKLKSI